MKAEPCIETMYMGTMHTTCAWGLCMGSVYGPAFLYYFYRLKIHKLVHKFLDHQFIVGGPALSHGVFKAYIVEWVPY